MTRNQIPYNKDNITTYPPKGEWIASGAIRIPHSDEDEGAQSPSTGLTEYDYNTPVAHAIGKILCEFGIHVDVYSRDYWGEYVDMVNTMNDRSKNIVDRYEFDIPLHLNCANGKATGTEILHHYLSEKGKLLASCLIGSITANFGTSKHRGGLVPLAPGDRAYIIVAPGIDPTNCVEAAYIDNPNDEKKLRKYWLSYDESICDGLIRYLKALGISDPRFDKWKWKPGQNLSDEIKEMINGMDSSTCPVCDRTDCNDYISYLQSKKCKNR